MSKLSKHKEQFERVQRWYEIFKEINKGRIHNRTSEFYQDEVYAFFINCYHLKDWIINDKTVVILGTKAKKRKHVENYINSVDELKICADICNGSKHLCFDKEHPPRSGKKPEFGSKTFKVTIGTEPTKIAVKTLVNTSSGPKNAFDLATKCIKAWEKFYSINNL